MKTENNWNEEMKKKNAKSRVCVVIASLYNPNKLFQSIATSNLLFQANAVQQHPISGKYVGITVNSYTRQ